MIMHYTGTLTDGTPFDSSKNPGRGPFEFCLGARQVILGWEKGVASMTKGEKAILRCAPDYAYGSSGTGPIPPNATLLFEVELLGRCICMILKRDLFTPYRVVRKCRLERRQWRGWYYAAPHNGGRRFFPLLCLQAARLCPLVALGRGGEICGGPEGAALCHSQNRPESKKMSNAMKSSNQQSTGQQREWGDGAHPLGCLATGAALWCCAVQRCAALACCTSLLASCFLHLHLQGGALVDNAVPLVACGQWQWQ
jgi:hypothetical protein